MFLKYFLSFTIIAASVMAEQSQATKHLDELKSMLANIEEYLSRESTDFSCIEKALCLQAMDTSDPGHNPIKILARLTREHGLDTIRDEIDHYPHLQLALEALEIGNEFHIKHRCQMAFSKCEVPSAQLQETQKQVTVSAPPTLNNDDDIRSKRSTGCRRSKCQAYIISCFFLSITVVGSPCWAGVSAACIGCDDGDSSSYYNSPGYGTNFGRK